MARGVRSPEEPLAADRRTLMIAIVAMLALVGVGVASAALFTGSACEAIQPTAEEGLPVAGSDVPVVVDQAFPDLTTEQRGSIVASLSELAGQLGPVTGVASVSGADGLRAAPSGPIATGERTYTLADDGAAVRGVASFDDPTVVVGDGSALYAIAAMNELTGQIDAVQPLDRSLEAVGSCLDSATVNVPFAFHLDAGDGELLVLRVEEDGAEPQLELRGRMGVTWTAPLDVGTLPPGVLGERLSARMGDDLVVAARRATAMEGVPAVTAVARSDGEHRWTVLPDALPLDDEPSWLEVAGMTDEVVILVLYDEDRTRSRLVGVGTDDGAVRWSDETRERRLGVEVVEDGAYELLRVDDHVEVRRLDLWSGERGTAWPVGVDAGRLAATPRTAVVAPDDGGLVVAAEDGQIHPVPLDVEVRDVAATADGGTVVLLADDERAIAVTFGAS